MPNIDPYDWTEARVTYPDWQGTFQIDEKRTGPDSLYTLTGVDRDAWTIIGLDWGAGERGPHEMHVIAVPRGADITAQVEAQGYIEATDLQIHDLDPFDIIQRVIHLADFRARTRGVTDLPIKIGALGDIPEQDEDREF